MTPNQLPPLPEPDTHCFDDDTGKDVWSYTADQMHAYALAALAQQAQEPVAWLYVDTVGERYLCFSRPTGGGTITNLYTTPPAPQPAPVDELPDLNPEDFVVAVVFKQLGGFAPVTAHGVRVTHKPSRVSVVVDSERSQHRNRQLALEALRAITHHQAHPVPAPVDELIEALEGLMDWQVKNVALWHNRAYDRAYRAIKKHRASLQSPHTQNGSQAMSEAITQAAAYDLIDRFLRNNLYDDDYAEYSKALEAISQPAPSPQPAVPVVSDEQIRKMVESIQDPDTVPAFSNGYYTLTPDELRRAILALRPAVEPMTPEQRDAAIDAKLAEYGYPANTRNAARAGWYACLQALGITAKAEGGV